MATCKFKCATKINHTVQAKIFSDFYKLDQNRKHAFIKQPLFACLQTLRPTKETKIVTPIFYFRERIRIAFANLLLVYFGYITEDGF